MKFGICNETFGDWELDKACAAARSIGYTGIEIAPFTLGNDIRKLSAQQRTEIRTTVEQNDLHVIGLHWLLAKTPEHAYHLTSPEAEVRRRTAAYLGDLARLCGELGGQVMVLGSPQQRNRLPGVSHHQAMEYAAEVLRQVMPVCESSGTMIAVEPLGPAEGNFLLTAVEGNQLIEMVDSPCCKLHLDVKAMASESEPTAEVIRVNQKHLVHFHANDPNLLGPGMGQVDFVPILAALRDIGYDRWVSVEVFDYRPGAQVIAETSIRNLQAALGQ